MTPPTRYALVPVEATEEMLLRAGKSPSGVSPRGGTDWLGKMLPKYYRAMIAASPNGGAVTAADLERAAEAGYARFCLEAEAIGCKTVPWLEFAGRVSWIDRQRAALTALGLTVADAPAGEVVDAQES